MALVEFGKTEIWYNFNCQCLELCTYVMSRCQID